MRVFAKLDPPVERLEHSSVREPSHRLLELPLVLLLSLDVLAPALERLGDLAVREEPKRLARHLRRLHHLLPPRKGGAQLLVRPPRHRLRRRRARLVLVLDEVLPLLPRRAELFVREALHEPGHLETRVRDRPSVLAPRVKARRLALVDEKICSLVQHRAVLPRLANHLAPPGPRGAVLEPTHRSLRRDETLVRLVHLLPPRGPRLKHHAVRHHVRRALHQPAHVRRLLHHLAPPRPRARHLERHHPRRDALHLRAELRELIRGLAPPVERPGDRSVAHEPHRLRGDRALFENLVDALAPPPQRPRRAGVHHDADGAPERGALLERLAPRAPPEPREAALRELQDALVRLALAHHDGGEMAPRVERPSLGAVEHAARHLGANLAVVDALRREFPPPRERGGGGDHDDATRHLPAHLLQPRLLERELFPRHEAPNRRAVEKPRHDGANLLLLSRRVRGVLAPLVERGVELLVREPRRDPRELRARVQELVHLRAPPEERAGEVPLAHALRDARHHLAAALLLVKRRPPLDVEEHLDPVLPLRLDVPSDGAERRGPRRLHAPRAEHPRSATLAREQQRAAVKRVPLLRRRPPTRERFGKVLPAPQRQRALEVHLFLRARLLRRAQSVAPLREARAKRLAVPEPKRVQLHDVAPTAPPLEAALQRLALPEAHRDHPVLHRGFARDAKRPQRGGVPDPHPKRRRDEFEIGVPALARVVVDPAASPSIVVPPRVVRTAVGAMPPDAPDARRELARLSARVHVHGARAEAFVLVLVRDAPPHSRHLAIERRVRRARAFVRELPRRPARGVRAVRAPDADGGAQGRAPVHRAEGAVRQARLFSLVLDPPIRVGVERELEQEAVVVDVLLGNQAVLREDGLVRLGRRSSEGMRGSRGVGGQPGDGDDGGFKWENSFIRSGRDAHLQEA